MESLNKKQTEVNYFQMPLHYPRYTKKDYLEMAEWKLDQLLSQYGLTVHGDLAYKRDFAIGAFLWPEFRKDSKMAPTIYRTIINDDTLLDNKFK